MTECSGLVVHGLNITEEESAGGPGIVVIYHNDEAIHAVLGLSAVGGIAGLEQGSTAGESKKKFCDWLDAFVMERSSGHCLVYLNDNRRSHGLYQELSLNQYHKVMGELLFVLRDLHTECMANDLSIGAFHSVMGAATGQCLMVPNKFGPFLY